jgi:hypothetical protein
VNSGGGPFSPAQISKLSMCVGKDQFTDKATANGVAARMRRRGKGRINVYKCKHGDHFHVGTEPFRRPKTPTAAKKTRIPRMRGGEDSDD